MGFEPQRCDLPGVTPGTASAAMKRPFFGAWASGTTAQSWPKGIDYSHAGIDPEKARKPGQNRDSRDGFLAIPKARSAHSSRRPLRRV